MIVLESLKAKAVLLKLLRWILKILHDPCYIIPWELWCLSIIRSCRIFSINSTLGFKLRVWGLRGLSPKL